MSNTQQIMSVNIDAWSANSLGLHDSQAWNSWAQDLQWPEEGKLEVSAIPPMMRRRMSSLSKMAVQTAIELLNQHDVDYLVFASRHGELQRSAQLINDILCGEEASPMAFSQSVHNTAAGLSTIATKKPIPLTSIAAADNTFQSALLEAWLYLQANPTDKVLVLDFDEPLPSPYQQYEENQFQGYAIGLVLSAGESVQFAAQPNTRSQQNDQALPQGLAFLRHFLTSHNRWQIHSKQQSWTWQR
ncbi:beta-ketoacyl synthase chain length factor [Vibrio sp. NTOU-M3]|uniref:beta-ketoacyl synthase chain length factor n=1 Tax=unclassified Vibrio TaxID=2614977 RepID=UPI00349FB8AF